jgi:hypothetical protein
MQPSAFVAIAFAVIHASGLDKHRPIRRIESAALTVIANIVSASDSSEHTFRLPYCRYFAEIHGLLSALPTATNYRKSHLQSPIFRNNQTFRHPFGKISNNQLSRIRFYAPKSLQRPIVPLFSQTPHFGSARRQI